MKNLLLILLFVLPTALFSAGPSCLEGMEVSIIDASGKVIQSGKLNKQGKLTLDKVEVRGWDVKLSNNGNSIVLGVNKSSGGIDKATPIMYKTKISNVKGGSDLLKSNHEAAHVVQQKGGLRSEASLEETNTSERAEGSINTSRSNIKNQNKRTSSSGDGLDNDCDDDIEISVTSIGKGRIKVSCVTLKR